MNRVCLVGRITAKPELKYTGSNLAFTRFSIAINRTFTGADGQRGVDFINIITWRKQAENVCKYLDKGSKVSIEGRIQTGNYTDKDGNKRYSFDIVADSVQFLDSKKDSVPSNAPTPYDFVEQPTNDVNVEADPFADFGDNVAIDDNFLD